MIIKLDLHSKNTVFMKPSTAVEAVNKILTGKRKYTDWAKGGAIAIVQKHKLTDRSCSRFCTHSLS